MIKSRIVLLFFAFLLGCLLSGVVVALIASQAMIKIHQGDMVAGIFTHTRYSQAIQKYEEAQHLWPFLRYNTIFTSQLRDERAFLAVLLTKPAVTIFFKNPLNYTNVSNLKQNIQSIPGVTKVKYVSQEDALTIYKQLNKNNSQLL